MSEQIIINNKTPRNPSSSAKTEKIKSVDCSGTKSSCDWEPFVRPLPVKPPEPIAIFD